jgi:hypothetical protein
MTGTHWELERNMSRTNEKPIPPQPKLKRKKINALLSAC